MKKKQSSTTRYIIALIIFIAGLALACYTGGWILFIKPIIGCLKAFDSHTLTAMMVGLTVLKCFFASIAAWLIVTVTSFISALIAGK